MKWTWWKINIIHILFYVCLSAPSKWEVCTVFYLCVYTLNIYLFIYLHKQAGKQEGRHVVKCIIIIKLSSSLLFFFYFFVATLTTLLCRVLVPFCCCLTCTIAFFEFQSAQNFSLILRICYVHNIKKSAHTAHLFIFSYRNTFRINGSNGQMASDFDELMRIVEF